MSMGGANDVLPAGGGGINPELGLGGKRKSDDLGSDRITGFDAIVVTSGLIQDGVVKRRSVSKKENGVLVVQSFCRGTSFPNAFPANMHVTLGFATERIKQPNENLMV
jgi:hypothetical protein